MSPLDTPLLTPRQLQALLAHLDKLETREDLLREVCESYIFGGLQNAEVSMENIRVILNTPLFRGKF